MASFPKDSSCCARGDSMSGFTIELACVEDVIRNEIGQGAIQKQIAETYALGLLSSWPTDWAEVNAMIIKRWSRSGLNRIKTMAWKKVER